MKTNTALDSFTRAYLVCALWSSNDESTPQGGEPFDRNYSVEDFAEVAIERAVADCTRFQEENETWLSNYRSEVVTNGDSSETEYAGHDFWLTRNGHGAGFWDREGLLESTADKLTEASKAFGQIDPYLGDDGKIYLA